jgi:hypothetical protein
MSLGCRSGSSCQPASQPASQPTCVERLCWLRHACVPAGRELMYANFEAEHGVNPRKHATAHQLASSSAAAAAAAVVTAPAPALVPARGGRRRGRGRGAAGNSARAGVSRPGVAVGGLSGGSAHANGESTRLRGDVCSLVCHLGSALLSHWVLRQGAMHCWRDNYRMADLCISWSHPGTYLTFGSLPIALACKCLALSHLQLFHVCVVGGSQCSCCMTVKPGSSLLTDSTWRLLSRMLLYPCVCLRRLHCLPLFWVVFCLTAWLWLWLQLRRELGEHANGCRGERAMDGVPRGF